MQLFSVRFVYMNVWTNRLYSGRQGKKGCVMSNVNKLAQPEIREKVASSILHLLAILPEAHKNMFIWKHYHGWPEAEIASRLGCSASDVENTLLEIRRLLVQRTQAVLLGECADFEETRQRQQCVACSA
jgi:DNA-directed RNA polymerase specialized sigma24 family protein